MTALYIIGFILLVVATVALLGLTPEQINKDINALFHKQQTLKDQALTARGKKKKSRILLELERMRRALQGTGKEKQFSLACTAALLLMVAGCIVAIAIDNMFLIPVLAVAFALIPFAYLAKTISAYETQVRQELETALSIITTSYIRSDNIVSAVQENLAYAFIYHVAREQQNETQLKLDSYVTRYAVGKYDALKQGESWEDYIDRNELVNGAYSLLGFPRIITLEYRESVTVEGKYTVSRPTIYALAGDAFGVIVEYEITIPFELFNRKVADITVPIGIVSQYKQK